jgi:hypothetical protein
MDQRGKKMIRIILVSLFVFTLTFAIPINSLAESNNPPQQPSYIDPQLSVVDNQSGLKTTTVSVSPYRVTWRLTVSEGVGTFKIHGEFGDGGNFT